MCISISGVYVCFGFLGLLVGLIFMVCVCQKRGGCCDYSTVSFDLADVICYMCVGGRKISNTKSIRWKFFPNRKVE